ncbi:MAG: hypothetical protein ABW328_04475 [Ilumatobacteraceae bacterium]
MPDPADPTVVVTTPAGQDRYDTVTAGIAAIAGRRYGDLPADDLATAAQVLTTVTRRARAELSR